MKFTTSCTHMLFPQPILWQLNATGSIGILTIYFKMADHVYLLSVI